MGKRHIPHKQRIELLDIYDKSKVTVKAYAAENGIGYSTFQRWLRDRKITFNATDDVHTLNAAIFQPSDQRPNACQPCQSYDKSDTPIHFMDITPPTIHLISPEGIEAEAYPQKTSDSISTSPASAHTVVQASHQTNPSEPHNQLDLFLPNGIRMTFHQASLDASITLIKSLV